MLVILTFSLFVFTPTFAPLLKAQQSGRTFYPPFEELQPRLEQWQRQYPDLINVRVVGTTAQGRPLFVVRLTDTTVPDEVKEHIVITDTHSGSERSGATTVFYLMKWLLSGEPRAREILRRQVVVCIPVVNPDGYEAGTQRNTLGLDPHTDWIVEGPDTGPKEATKNPEAVAVQGVLDEYKPEAYIDVHGDFVSYPGSWMIEGAVTYDRDVNRLMDEAALSEGYPSTYAEPILPNSTRTAVGNQAYAVHRYRTLSGEVVSAWERSGFLRLRRLLEVGNEIWPGEYYPGHPVQVISSYVFNMVTAYGQSAAERRLSRVELWNKRRQITQGYDNPWREGKTLYVCTTSPAAAEKYLAPDLTLNLPGAPPSMQSLRSFVAKTGENPHVNAEYIRRFVEGHPKGDFPEPLVDSGGGGAKPGESSPIEHGLSLRLRIPFVKAKLIEVRLNGHPIQPSESDGYLMWVARGFTYMQVNIPPEKSKAQDLFVITWQFDPGEKRVQGEGW